MIESRCASDPPSLGLHSGMRSVLRGYGGSCEHALRGGVSGRVGLPWWTRIGGRVMRTYMGVSIWRCGLNSSGMRWYAMTVSGTVRADTLKGVKELIKERAAMHKIWG